MSTAKWTVNFEGEVLDVTEHALRDLCRRWRDVERGPRGEPVQALQSLLNRALEEELSEEDRLRRLLAHNNKDFKCYRTRAWRFVIIKNPADPNRVLVTVEVDFREDRISRALRKRN